MHSPTPVSDRARWLALLVALSQAACSDSMAAGPQTPDPRLHPDLVTYLGPLQGDEFVSVVIHSSETAKLSSAQRVQVLGQATGATRRERRLDGRRKVVQALQAKFSQNQAELLNALQSGLSAGHVRKLRKLWSLGAAAGEIRKTFLDLLLVDQFAMANVPAGGIRLDLPRRVFAGAGTSSSRPANTWNVEKIGAHTLQSSSVIGTGAVVAVIDSGFEVNHPDIDDRIWANPDESSNGSDDDGNGKIDDLKGWDFYDDDAIVSDSSSHGTQVSGIVAGTGDGGTQTGVAPGASLMLLKVGAAADDVTQGQVWEALQYALAEEADIVNLSLNWAADLKPDYASWREEIDILSQAGVLVVAIAGNDASERPFINEVGDHEILDPPDSVTTPGRVPSAMTAGATDSSDALWYEDLPPPDGAVGSNEGPVTWQDVPAFADYPDPPGLLKPDVVAPGVDIVAPFKPGAPNNLYWTDDGTSFAAPHVAGLAALLLQNDSELGPYDLRYLIQETALDLGDAGPDISYGWGRIDAVDAAALTIDSTPYDLSITATGDEWTTDDIWVDYDDDGVEDTPIAEVENHLYARVRNLGGQVVSDVRLAFYYADVATIGIDGFDPNGDADPSDGDFTFIGSYTVPLLGPSGSDHDTAIGLASWTIPVPTSDHWCVGVAARAEPPNGSESDLTDNLAFRNFFELVLMSSASMEFRLAPPPRRKREPFDFEIRRIALPERAHLTLVVDPRLAPMFEQDAPGRRPPPAGAGKRDQPAYLDLDREVVRFRGLRAPGGEPMRLSLAVHVPMEVELPRDARVVMSVLDAGEKKVGGLTVELVRDPSLRRAGPYSLKKR